MGRGREEWWSWAGPGRSRGRRFLFGLSCWASGPLFLNPKPSSASRGGTWPISNFRVTVHSDFDSRSSPAPSHIHTHNKRAPRASPINMRSTVFHQPSIPWFPSSPTVRLPYLCFLAFLDFALDERIHGDVGIIEEPDAADPPDAAQEHDASAAADAVRPRTAVGAFHHARPGGLRPEVGHV